MAWTIIIAGSYREARSATENFLRNSRRPITIESTSTRFLVTDDITGETGVIDYTDPHSALRRLEGARPDQIVIAGDYTRWNPSPGSLTTLWYQIQSTVIRTPGSKVVWW